MLVPPSDIVSASVLCSSLLTFYVCAYVHGVHERALCEHACGGQRSTSGIITKELFILIFLRLRDPALSILEFAK